MWVATGSYAEPLQSDEQPESWHAFTPDLHTARLTANRMREMNFDYRMNKLCPTLTAPGFFSHQSDMLDVSGARAWDSNRFIRDFVRHNMHAHYMYMYIHARTPAALPVGSLTTRCASAECMYHRTSSVTSTRCSHRSVARA